MTAFLRLGGHLGDRVSALVDGQLSPEEVERAWSHTMSCPACRRLVEREGWLKSRLAGMSAPVVGVPEPRPALIGALYDVDAWAAVDEIERRGHARRGLTAVGVGSVGAAVLGIVALTGAPAGSGERLPVRPAPAQVGVQTGGLAGARVGAGPTSTGSAPSSGSVMASVVSLSAATVSATGASGATAARHRGR